MADRGNPSSTNGHHNDGTVNNEGGERDVVPAPRHRFVRNAAHYRDLVWNFITSRLELLKRWLDPRRNLSYECGWPEGYIEPSFYQRLYDLDPLAGRVVEVFPKECFQVPPEIYEDEDPDTVTAWEEALYGVCDALAGENSYSQTSRLTRLVEFIRRADVVSGICSYGCVIVGLDDGRDLSQPADLRPYKPKKRKRKQAQAASAAASNPPEELAKDVASQTSDATTNATYFPLMAATVPVSTGVPDERPYVRDADGNLVLPGKNYDPNDPLAKPPPRKYPKGVTRGLQFLHVYPEAYCRVSEWDMDPHSKRFGRPTRYTVQFGAYGQGEGSVMPVETKEVHWTRVVHLTDVSHHAPDNPVYAAPRQRPVLPRILDARKVYGPDAESFYRNGVPTWVFESHPELGAVELDKQSLKDEWEEGNNSLSRMFATEGGSMKPLTTSIPDPTPHVMIHVQAICYKLGIPQRIFMGSERGELASSQDDAAWNDRLRERQNNYLTPMVIEPIIDRLISLGVLPEPEAEDGYKVWWPDLESQSQQEKSTVAGAKTTAIATFFDPAKELFTRMAEMDFWTKVMGYDEREAKQIVQNAEKEREKRKKEKEQEQKDQMKVQDEQARAGMERDLEFQQKQAEQQAQQAADQGAPGAATSQAQGEAATDSGAGLIGQLSANEEDLGNPASRARYIAEILLSLTDPADYDELFDLLGLGAVTENAFCPTGPGGGIKNDCPPPNAGAARPKLATPAADAAARSLIDSLKGRKATAEEAAQLHAHLDKMNVGELAKLRKDYGISGGGVKQAGPAAKSTLVQLMRDRLLEKAEKSQPGPKPPQPQPQPNPPPPPPPKQQLPHPELDPSRAPLVLKGGGSHLENLPRQVLQDLATKTADNYPYTSTQLKKDIGGLTDAHLISLVHSGMVNVSIGADGMPRYTFGYNERVNLESVARSGRVADSLTYRPPTTLKELNQLAKNYATLSGDERAQVAQYFGIPVEKYYNGMPVKPGDPNYDKAVFAAGSSIDFRDTLKARMEKNLNPDHISEHIQKNNQEAAAARQKLLEIDRRMTQPQAEARQNALLARAKQMVSAEAELLTQMHSLQGSSKAVREKRKRLGEQIEASRNDRARILREVDALSGDYHQKKQALAHAALRESLVKDGNHKVDEKSLKQPAGASSTITRNLQKARDFLDGIIAPGPGGKPLPDCGVSPQQPGFRAHYKTEHNKMNVDPYEDSSTIVHEYGHHIDTRAPGALKASLEFLEHRVGNEKPISMQQKYNGNYKAHETGRKDKFDTVMDEHSAYYTGKSYGTYATEVVSMGVQKMYEDPVRMAKNDPEFFDFIHGILSGKTRRKEIPAE